MLGNLAYKSISWEPLLGSLRRARLRDKTVILMYHEIAADDQDIEAWTVVRRCDFVSQMEYLQAHFEVVSLDEALRRESEPHRPRPLAVVTFDDGNAGNHDILLPVVEALRLPVTVFVATLGVLEQTPYWYDRVMNAIQRHEPLDLDLCDLGLGRHRFHADRGPGNWNKIQSLLTALKQRSPADRNALVEDIERRAVPAHDAFRLAPMNIEQVRALAASRWVTIGAHSHCHNILTQIAPNDAAESVLTSKHLLESWTGREVAHFAYPNGDQNGSVVAAVKHAGFRSAVTTEPRPWASADDRFLLPRIAVGRYDNDDRFRINLFGGLGALVSGHA